jgi:hypothetical protein
MRSSSATSAYQLPAGQKRPSSLAMNWSNARSSAGSPLSSSGIAVSSAEIGNGGPPQATSVSGGTSPSARGMTITSSVSPG